MYKYEMGGKKYFNAFEFSKTIAFSHKAVAFSLKTVFHLEILFARKPVAFP